MKKKGEEGLNLRHYTRKLKVKMHTNEKKKMHLIPQQMTVLNH